MKLFIAGVVLGVTVSAGAVAGASIPELKRWGLHWMCRAGRQHEGNRWWLLNPGSPTQRRSQPHHTVATLDLAAGRIVATEIVVVDPPGVETGRR